MKHKTFLAILVGFGMAALSAPAAKANHYNSNYYATPPFNPGYSAPRVEASPYGVQINTGGYYQTPDYSQNRGYYQSYPSYQSSGCQRVDDGSDYNAIHQINHRNRSAVYRAQQNLYPGQCRVVRVQGHGDDTYLAIDNRSIRWATQNEIGNYYRYR